MKIQITADRVVTGDGAVYRDAGVVVDGNRIEAVGPSEELASLSADETLSLSDHTVLPGLIDVHTHISSVGDPDRLGYGLGNSVAARVVDTIENARATVDAGITTIRDVGSPNDIPMQVRDAISDSQFRGPRIVACGEGLTASGGHGDEFPNHLADAYSEGRKGRVANGVAEVKKAVREQLQKDADAIKVWATGGVIDPEGEIDTIEYSPEEFEAIVAEADRHNVHVASHAHPPEGIVASVEAGVRSIEHGMYVDEESAELMAENDVYLVSTMSVMKKIMNNPDVPEYYRTNTTAAMDHHTSQLQTVRDRGVPLAMGTDAGAPTYPHGDNAEELACYVEAGLDPLDAIEISTRGSASLLEFDDLGVLEAGNLADVIAVRGDPTADITTLIDEENIQFVMVDGRTVKRTAT